MRKLTINDFQERVDNKFSNIKVTSYNGYNKPVKMKCLKCGYDINYKIASTFLNSNGCSKCNNCHKLTTEEFIYEAKKIHGDKYDYSESEVINNKIPVKIFCKKCQNYFLQRASIHLNGGDCKCYKREKLSKASSSSTREFISKMKNKFPGKFIYDKVKYINNTKKVEVFCKRCKTYFWQKPYKLLIGYGCSNCFMDRIKEGKKLSIEEFIKRGKPNLFDYSRIKEIKSSIDKLPIFCKKCNNLFWQNYHDHFKGYGCPYCNESKGEREIRNWLIENKISFLRNKKFDDLIDNKKLSYDFYIPSLNLLIEYNGIQHYKRILLFHKNNGFHKQLHHDWLKRNYARKHNYSFLVISYKEDICLTLMKLIKK